MLKKTTVFLLLIFNNFIFIKSEFGLEKIAQASYSNGIVNSISWLNYQGDYYLAAGGQTEEESKIKIYQFDANKKSLKLTKITAQFDGGTINALSWLTIGNNHYLAVGGSTAVVIYKLEIIKKKLVLSPISGSLNCCDVNTLGWINKNNNYYLAVAGADKLLKKDIKVYLFDQKTEFLSLTDAQVSFYSGVVNTIDWLSISNQNHHDSEVFLAAGGTDFNSVSQELRIYKFSIDPTSAKESLILVSSASLHNGSASTVNWLKKEGKYYLLVGAYDGVDQNQLEIYNFNPQDYSFEELDNMQSLQENIIKSAQWISIGLKDYFAAGCDDGGSVQETAIYQYDSEGNVIMLTDAIVAAKGIISDLKWLKIKNEYYLTTAGDSNGIKGIRIYKFNHGHSFEELEKEGHGFFDIINSALNSFYSLFKN